MRICLNLLAALAGGQLTRARAFIERFATHAPDSRLIVLKERSTLNDCRFAAVHDLQQLSLGGLGRLRALRRRSWEYLFLRALIRRTGADVLLTFSHYLPPNFPSGIPSVVGVANLAPFSALAYDCERGVRRLRLRSLRRSIVSSARRASRVIALSETCKRILIDHGIAEQKIVVAPNGVETSWSERGADTDVLAQYGITRPYVLYVSHFYRYKDHPTLLEAYARLPADLRRQHQLVLVGGVYDVDYFRQVQRYGNQPALGDALVVIPGEGGERLRALYRGCKLFVFPSLVENSPNSLLEAMAAGAAVLASDLQPMPEFAGDAARYFAARQSADLAARLTELLPREESLAALRRSARARAEAYSWDQFVRTVIRTCEDAVREQRARTVGG